MSHSLRMGNTKKVRRNLIALVVILVLVAVLALGRLVQEARPAYKEAIEEQSAEISRHSPADMGWELPSEGDAQT